MPIIRVKCRTTYKYTCRKKSCMLAPDFMNRLTYSQASMLAPNFMNRLTYSQASSAVYIVIVQLCTRFSCYLTRPRAWYLS